MQGGQARRHPGNSRRFGSSRAVFRRRCAAFHRSVWMLQFILDRAKEPSTYAGIATLLTAAGIHYSTDVFNAAVAVVVAVAGLVAVLLPEKKASLARSGSSASASVWRRSSRAPPFSWPIGWVVPTARRPVCVPTRR